MAFSVLLSGGSAADSASNATTTPVDTSGLGIDLIILTASWYIGVTFSPAISDSKGNTWTSAIQGDDGVSNRTGIFFCLNPTVGAGHTFQIDGTDIFPLITYLAVSGSANLPADQTNFALASAVTSLQLGSITPTENDELVVTSICNAGDGINFSINESYIAHWVNDFVGSSTVGGGAAHKIQTSAILTEPTWSWTNASDTVGLIASFKAAASVVVGIPFFTTIGAKRI